MDHVEMEELLEELENKDIIKKYAVDGKFYGAIRNFRVFQHPRFPKYKHPMPKNYRNYVSLTDEITVTEGVKETPLQRNVVMDIAKEASLPPKSSSCSKEELREVKSNTKDICPAKNAETIPYEEIIEDLNLKAGTNYKHTSRASRDLIKARWNEGWRIEDFKKVHSHQVAKWKGDTKMSEYLRPVTLYRASKFESYLNSTGPKEKEVCCMCKIPASHSFNGRTYCRECYPWEKDYVDAEGNPSVSQGDVQ